MLSFSYKCDKVPYEALENTKLKKENYPTESFTFFRLIDIFS